MDWIADPTALLGLGTLVLLEIVLGVDNLIFIAILTERLPERDRASARAVGLSLALLTRLGLLAGISWLQSLTAPIFSLRGIMFSVRDLILIGGGLFLLFKGTTELHGRVDGMPHAQQASGHAAAYWQVIVQIVLLDIVFSLDSVITAVGMVNDLPVMMLAVVIAVLAMIWASGPLMAFVSAHMTVVILCLSFLLMIGFSLVMEGFGVHIPKGYLYAAIAFSVAVEALNQIAQRNLARTAAADNLRARAADAILHILRGGRTQVPLSEDLAPLMAARSAADVFAPQERAMMESVLGLGDRPVSSLMTAEPEIVWLDIDAPHAFLQQQILRTGHAAYPVRRGGAGPLLGAARATDLVHDLVNTGRIDVHSLDRRPLRVHESTSTLDVIELLKTARVGIAIVTDEQGAVRGVVTPTDLLAAIVGGESEESGTITRRR